MHIYRMFIFLVNWRGKKWRFIIWRRECMEQWIATTIICLRGKHPSGSIHAVIYIIIEYIQTYIKSNQISWLAEPVLNCWPQCVVGSKMQMTKLQVGHWRRIVAALPPFTQSFSFISETIRRNLRVMHYFLEATIEQVSHNMTPKDMQRIVIN